MRKIETVTKETNTALKSGIAGYIKAGKLISEAREIYKKDDVQFGKWCKTKLSYPLDQKAANRYMHLANCFSDNLPEHIPLSGLYELSAPKNDDFRAGALEILGDDNASIKDVKAAIKQAKAKQEITSELDGVLAKVNDMSERDLLEVFMKIVSHIGITKVQDWLEMEFLETTEQEKAA